MKKLLSILAALVAAFSMLTYPASGTIPVHDYALFIQQVQAQVSNLAQFIKTAENTYQNLVVARQQFEQILLSVERAGDPAAYKALLGMQELAALVQSGVTSWDELQNLANLYDPNTISADVAQILNRYQIEPFSGFTTRSGTHVDAVNSPFETARWKIASQVQEQLSQVQAERQQLLTQRSSVMQQIANASTEAEVNKLHATLAGIDSGLKTLSDRERTIDQSANAQRQQLQAGETLARSQREQQREAGLRQQIDNDLDRFPMDDLGARILRRSAP